MNYKEIIQMLTSDPEKMTYFFRNMMKTHYDDEEYWEHICENTNFTLNFIQDNHTFINIKYLLKYQRLEPDILQWMQNNVTFYPDVLQQLIENQTLAPTSLQFYIDKMYPIDWGYLAKHQQLPCDIIMKYHDKWDWGVITTEQNLTSDMVDKYEDMIDWTVLPLNYNSHHLFTEAFIEKYKEKPFWDNIGLVLKETQIDVIQRYKDYISENGWYSVLIYMDLSVDDIESVLGVLPDDLDKMMVWDSISTHQVLSMSFIEKHRERVNWKYICAHQGLDWDFIRTHHEHISLYDLSRNGFMTMELIEKIEQNATLFKDTLDKDLLSL